MEPPRISACPIFPETTVTGLYIYVAAAFKFVQWAPKDASYLPFGRSRSSKVDDFGTNRKCICDFLFVLRLEFRAEVNHQETRVMGYPPVKNA